MVHFSIEVTKLTLWVLPLRNVFCALTFVSKGQNDQHKPYPVAQKERERERKEKEKETKGKYFIDHFYIKHLSCLH
jgi:hypothetical protein